MLIGVDGGAEYLESHRTVGHTLLVGGLKAPRGLRHDEGSHSGLDPPGARG